jgi:hypothetical protein
MYTLLSSFRRFECDGLHLGCGGAALLQVDDLFGAFDHQFKAHKLSYNLLVRHSLYLGSPHIN